MNSPYTKHLDATLDAPTSSAMTVPTYVQAPVAAQPMVIQSGSSDGGNKAAIALVAIVVAVIAAAGAFVIGRGTGPTWNELRRYEALAGREGEIRGRDGGWVEGRKQGRTEMQYLAKYERLRTQAGAFRQGWTSGMSIGQQMGAARTRYRYGYGYGGRGWGNGRYRGYGYGGYYGGSVNSAVASAQNIANATGQPVDVILN